MEARIAVRPVEGSTFTERKLVSTSPDAEVAAAVCYLLNVDPATLDPDGDLTAAFWPFEFDDLTLRADRAENIRAAIAHLTGALVMLGAPLVVQA